MKKIVAAAAATLLCASAAHAALLQHTVTFSEQATDWSNGFSVARFDASLGTLNSVTLALTGAMRSTSLFYDVNQPETIGVDFNGNLAISLPGYSTLSLLLSGHDNFLVPAGDSGPYNGLAVSGTNSYSLNSGLAAFIGSGALSGNAGSSATTTVNGSGNYDSEINTRTSGALTVTYNYTANGNAVPEPGALALVGLALAAASLALRRR